MKNISTYAFVLLLFIGACNLNESDPAVVNTVTSEVQIDLVNTFEPGKNFSFRLSTLEKHCTGSQIVTDQFSDDRTVGLSVNGLIGPVNCVDGEEIITKDLAFGLSPGTHDVIFNVGESLESNGTLTFLYNTISLDLPNAAGFTVYHNTMRLIPDSIVWGSITATENLTYFAGEFGQEIDDVARDSNLEDGYYGAFTVESGANVEVTAETSSLPTFHYVYRLDGEKSELKEAIQQFRTKHQESLVVTCTTWEGEAL